MVSNATTGDSSGGNVNDLTPITGEFIDFIKPNVTYEYYSTDIVRNHADKTNFLDNIFIGEFSFPVSMLKKEKDLLGIYTLTPRSISTDEF